MQLIPLSLGIPLGLLVAIGSVNLFLVARGKGKRTVIAVCLIVLGALGIVIGAFSR
jgi:arginine exporter protein ArgO